MSVVDKRAALELHRLAPEDRKWVLARLSPSEHDRVAPLLAELEQMKVRFEADDVLPFDSTPAPAAPAPAAPAEGTPAELLQSASADALCAVLADEPPWLIAALCGLQAWPWAAEVRSRMGLPPTLPALRDSPGRPAFRAALVEQVAARLPRTNGSNGHSHHAVLRDAAGGWRAIWPRMKQWLP